MSRNGRRHLLVDDPHHLLGRHAVGGEARHERARARADVDVELVDGPVDREEVERAQRADLVDAAREAAAAQYERRARLAAAPLRGRALRLRLATALRRPFEFYYLGHLGSDDDLSGAGGCGRRRRSAPSARSGRGKRRAPRAQAGRRDGPGERPLRRLRLRPERSRRPVLAKRATKRRILASNTKLFTTAAALNRFGSRGPVRHRGAGRPPARTAAASCAATSTCAAAATRVRQHVIRRARLRRRRGDARGPRARGEAGRRPARHGQRARATNRSSTRSAAGPTRATASRNGSARSARCPSTAGSRARTAARSRRGPPEFAAKKLSVGAEAHGHPDRGVGAASARPGTGRRRSPRSSRSPSAA